MLRLYRGLACMLLGLCCLAPVPCLAHSASPLVGNPTVLTAMGDHYFAIASVYPDFPQVGQKVILNLSVIDPLNGTPFVGTPIIYWKSPQARVAKAVSFTSRGQGSFIGIFVPPGPPGHPTLTIALTSSDKSPIVAAFNAPFFTVGPGKPNFSYLLGAFLILLPTGGIYIFVRRRHRPGRRAAAPTVTAP